MAKAWVGIGAVNITGHSNTQKVLTTIRENFKISLAHNSVDGKVSFSGVLDSEKNYISDNLSEYINAFVDVAKDPYILDNIYSDQIVGIFMMLARAGVSPKQAALFMNQPIIREFVQSADANKDYLSSSMFNEEFIELVLASFPTTSQALTAADGKINVANLSKNISDYTTSSLDDEQNAQQHLILNEFFGYIKAASGLFKLTQATNYDTSRFKSSDELRRKELKATNKIKGQRSEFKVGDPEALLAATHIGVLKEVLNKSDNALSAILKFNSAPFRSLINDIIDPYAGNQYLSNDKFTRVSNKLTGSLLDYIIQTNKDIFVPELTTGNSSIAVKYEEALAKFPDSTILNALQVVPGKTKNAPVTIKLKVNTKDAFDENVYTDLMRGLRDNPDTADFYKSLVRISIAQGTYRTAVSIKNVIPIEDYADVVSNLVRNAEVDDNVINFQKNNWFQRNNFRDEAVAPRVVPMNYVNSNVAPRTGFTGDESYQYSIPSAISYWEAEEGKTAQKAILGIGVNSKGSGNDLIIVPRLLNVKGGAIVDYNNSHQISAKEYATEASKDVNKYNELYGYQKVKYNDGTPVIMKRNEKSGPEYVYKLVNLYGDGRYVSEYYKDTTMPSQLENGTVKPKEELTDEQIISHLGSMILKPIDETETSEVAPVNEKNVVPSQQSTTVVDRYTDVDVKANPNTIYIFGDNTKRVGTGGQAQIRNNPNAMGIATKLAPSMEESAFMTDTDLDNNKAIIDADIAKIKATGKSVVLPKDGLGTGLAKLKEKAPETYKYLKQRLLEEFGFDNDNGTTSQQVALPSQQTEQSVVLPIQQNFTDGQGGRRMQPQFEGKSTMDLILSGDRTRTTRAQTDINRMINDYGLTKIEDLVGKIIPMSDKSGTVVETRITKVAPLTQAYQDATWQKEGWEKSVTDKLVGQYPYAIEFELVQPRGTTGTSEDLVPEDPNVDPFATPKQTENWEEENNDCPIPF